MENQNLILSKLSRLFPSSFSSCQLRTVTADVADNSIAIKKSKKIPHDNDQTTHNFLRSKPTKGPKCPHSSPVPNPNLKKNNSAVSRGSRHDICKTGGGSSVVSSVITNNGNNQVSCSSNSGFFSSSEDESKVKKDAETDTFFSLSSNSGDSFRLKTSSRRFRIGEETVMKTIKEKERSSFSSAKTSFDLTALSSKRGDMKKNYCNKSATTKKCSNKSQENNLFFSSSDHHAYYYSNKKASEDNARNRVRRTRVKRRSLKSGSMLIEESRAVEKRSTDPRGDFRASMVEMIVEKQMVSATELERLLLCFLSLNNVSYHEMIFEVFSEICETLFNN